MALDRGFTNVLLLGLSFMLVFTAFQTWGNIQKTMIDSISDDDKTFDGNAYISMALIYTCMAIFNWSAPSVISMIGAKFSMLIGAVTYLLFIMSFAIPHTWLLYVVSAIIGTGAALIWTGQGNYLALNSTNATISRNSGIFWAILQLSMFVGNLLVFFAFQNKDHIDSKTRQLVIWTLAAIALSGIVVMVFFPKPRHSDVATTASNESPMEVLKGAIQLFVTPNMLLLSATFFYTGIELGFWSAVYSSCIGFTETLSKRKELIGISGIFIGVGEVTGGAAFGILGSKTVKWGRDPIVIAGLVLHLLSFFLTFLNLPNNSPFGDTSDTAFITTNAIIAIFCSFLLGLGDACYNTQIYSILGGVYVDNSASAFAIFKFTQSVAAAISLAYASFFNLYTQLGILVVTSLIGTGTFVWVEWHARKRAVVVASSTSVSDGSDVEKME